MLTAINSYNRVPNNFKLLKSINTDLQSNNSCAKFSCLQNSTFVSFTGASRQIIEEVNKKNIGNLLPLYFGYRMNVGREVDLKELRKFILEQLRIPKTKIFMIKDGEHYAGFAHLNTHYSTIDSSKSAVILGLYVAPEFRSKGLAKQLVKKAQNWAKASNYSGLAVKTLSANEKSTNLYASEKDFLEVTKMYRGFFWKNSKVKTAPAH